MALFVKQNESRSDLQQRIAAELQEKAKKRNDLQDRPDGVDDSRYIEHTKRTTSLAWVWLLIIAAIVILSVSLVINGANA